MAENAMQSFVELVNVLDKLEAGVRHRGACVRSSASPYFLHLQRLWFRSAGRATKRRSGNEASAREVSADCPLVPPCTEPLTARRTMPPHPLLTPCTPVGVSGRSDPKNVRAAAASPVGVPCGARRCKCGFKLTDARQHPPVLSIALLTVCATPSAAVCPRQCRPGTSQTLRRSTLRAGCGAGSGTHITCKHLVWHASGCGRLRAYCVRDACVLGLPVRAFMSELVCRLRHCRGGVPRTCCKQASIPWHL